MGDTAVRTPLTHKQHTHTPAPTTVAREENVLEVLGRSLAPPIYGHKFIKKALVLQAIGGA